MEDHQPPLSLNLADPSEASLSKFAGRIGKLLTVSSIRASPDLAGSLDDFLGAVYSLIQAKHHDFTDRTTRPIEIAAVEKRLFKSQQDASGQTGNPLRGFTSIMLYFARPLSITHPENHCRKKRVRARTQD
jgi:hypothetical protein